MLMIKEITYFTHGILVKETPCSLVIDSESCTNVVSTMLIKRLQISTQHHPKPYKFQWLNDRGTMKVVSQALISFTLEKYKYKVICDVFPMLVGDILLGQPWQFDRKVTYDGYLNRHSFIKDELLLYFWVLQMYLLIN